MNRAVGSQYSNDERAKIDLILQTMPATKVGDLEPYVKPEPSVLKDADQVLAEWEAETPRTSWSSIDLQPHMEPDDGRDAPTLLTRSDGLCFLYAGKRNEVHGEYESGKSWLAGLAVCEVIRRGEIACWIDFEDAPRSIVKRLRALGVDDQLLLECFRYIQPTQRLTPDAEIELRLELHGATLVVIDAMHEAMTTAGLDPNVNRDVAVWYDTVPRLAAKEGVAVLVLDHVAKDPAGRRGPVGGGHKTAAIDGASYLLDALTPFGRGSSGLLRLRLAKDRPGYVRGRFAGPNPTVAEITIDATDPEALVVGIRPPAATRGSEDWRPTHLMEAVSRFLESLNEPVSRNKITENIKGKQAYVVDAIEALVTEGFVERSKGPNNTKLHVSAKPFREDPS
jgi:AAA domain